MEAMDVSNFRSHCFQCQIMDIQLTFSVVKMKDCCYIWIGNKDAKLTNMAVAFPNKSRISQCSISIFGDVSETSSVNLAEKLAQKMGKPVYMSHNLEGDQSLHSCIEKRICEEIALCPEAF